MKYLETVRKEQGRMVVPEAFQEVEDGRVFEAIQIGGDIILLAGPLEKGRWPGWRSLSKSPLHNTWPPWRP